MVVVRCTMPRTVSGAQIRLGGYRDCYCRGRQCHRLDRRLRRLSVFTTLRALLAALLRRWRCARRCNAFLRAMRSVILRKTFGTSVYAATIAWTESTLADRFVAVTVLKNVTHSFSPARLVLMRPSAPTLCCRVSPPLERLSPLPLCVCCVRRGLLSRTCVPDVSCAGRGPCSDAT